MGARRRLRARGPVDMATYATHNKHLALTYEDIRLVLEAEALRAELRARRETLRALVEKAPSERMEDCH